MKRKRTSRRDTNLLESVRGLAARIQTLNEEALRQYTPVVDGLIRARSQDERLIEHTLGGLLDFCGYAPVLRLYRKLCRHYFTINPSAVASYVHAYREMWLPARPVSKERNMRQTPTPQPPTGRSDRRIRFALN